MRLLLALGIYCGLRLGDAACLDWSNVDMVTGAESDGAVTVSAGGRWRASWPVWRGWAEKSWRRSARGLGNCSGAAGP